VIDPRTGHVLPRWRRWRTFTIKVTDSAGDQASEPGNITISP
jgi:hypothetical protein